MSIVKYHLDEYQRDLFICNTCRCGFCQDLCPAYRVFKVESVCARGRMQIAQAFLERFIQASEKLFERISLCTICGYCTARCPTNALPLKLGVHVDPAAATEALRADVVNAGVEFEPYKDILRAIEEENNPYWELHEKRKEWLKAVGIKPAERADLLYFAGCTTSYRVKDTAQAMVKIIDNAKLPFMMLKDETCCGSTLFRIGYRRQARQMAERLIENIEKTKASLVVTSCAGCYRMLKVDYPKIIGKLPFEVLHATEFIKELISENRLKVKAFEKVVTWHDPCHLGRHSKVYEPPREVVNAYAKKFVEMEYNKEHSFCCGAGGGFRKAWSDLSLAIAHERINQAREVGAELLLTCCPFCYYNFKTVGGIEVYDLPIFIVKTLGL